jgi:hypothetical protein
MNCDGVNDDNSTDALRAVDLAERVADGDLTISAIPGSLQERVKSIIAEAGLDRKVAASLRQARINQLVAAEDAELAIEGIKLSQKEDGVGVPNTAVQMNMYRDGPPPEALDLYAEED